MRKEINEVKKVEEAKEKGASIAAFFDLDGTLMLLPSLEWRFFRILRYRKFIGVRNYFLWLREASRLLPRGINQVMHANKMYLQGVTLEERDLLKGPSFYPEAMERLAWHAGRGHLIVIMSGTLEPLAVRAARALEAELRERGLETKIRVCATRLEEKSGRWTGRILGEAMFGEAKARAVRRIASELELDLQRCFAYGDSSSDKWMLETVGKPAVVNPPNDLTRIARRNDWVVLRWGKENNSSPSALREQMTERTDDSDDELQVARAKTGFRA